MLYSQVSDGSHGAGLIGALAESMWRRAALTQELTLSLDTPPLPTARVQLTMMQPVPLSWLGSWSVAHGDGASTEAAAMVAVYVTANHLMDYFIPDVS